MKVILTQEVKGKGHEGDVVEVARGYAVNYLLPRKLAIPATPGNIKQLEARSHNIAKRNEARLDEAQGVAASIDGKRVVIEAKAGDEGKLFGSVTTTMIEEAVAAQLGADVDHRRMSLSHPIKELGTFEVTLGVYGDVRATLEVAVVREGQAADAVTEAAEPVTEETPAAEETEVEAPEEAPADEVEEPAEDADPDEE